MTLELDFAPVALPFRASPPAVATITGDGIFFVAVDLDSGHVAACRLDAGSAQSPLALDLEYPTGACVTNDGIVVAGVADGEIPSLLVVRGDHVGPRHPLPLVGAVLRAARPIAMGTGAVVVWEVFSGDGSTLCTSWLVGDEPQAPQTLAFDHLSAHLDVASGLQSDGIVVARVSGPEATAEVLWLDADLRVSDVGVVAPDAGGCAVSAPGVVWTDRGGSVLWSPLDGMRVGASVALDQAPPRHTVASLRLATDPEHGVAVLHRFVDSGREAPPTEHLVILSVDGTVHKEVLVPPSAGARLPVWVAGSLLVLPGAEADPVRVATVG